MSSTDLEKPAAAGELAPLSAEEAALGAAQHESIDRRQLKLPALGVINGVSKAAGDVPLGHLYNSLDKEDLGTETDVIIVGHYYGRFFSPKESSKAWSAQGDIAPANWPEEYAGKPFVELDDAVEKWREAVEAGDHDWGSGPPIQTTTNFVVIRVDDPQHPMRLSLKASDNTTASKIMTLLDRQRVHHDYTWTILADKRQGPTGNDYYGYSAERGAQVTDPELRQVAVEIALAFKRATDAGAVEEVGDNDADASKVKRQKKEKADGLGY